MKRHRIPIVLALILSAVGLEAQVISQAPKVDVEYDRTRDFTLLDTYDWMKAQKPAPNMANHIRLTTAIQKEMEELGFSVDTNKPKVRVLYQVSTRKKVEAASSQRESAWDSTNLTTDFIFESTNMGTLTLELFDGETNARIWKATTTQELGTPDKAEKIINEAVKRLFTKYPTREQK